MKVVVTTDHQGRCEQLVWEKAPFWPCYILRLEINGEVAYKDHTEFSREYVAKAVKAARGVVGKEFVSISK